jgi:predicted HAD superfamily Cof-like phosphohydrolase
MTNFDKVKEFHRTFSHPVGTSPSLSPLRSEEDNQKIRDLRFELIREEVQELSEALAADDVVGVADALTDILYVVYGAGAVFGIDLDATYAEVHRSNMSKLGADGKPIYRADGKVLKGPDYSPPDLKTLLGVG